jgi:hypothetical protein
VLSVIFTKSTRNRFNRLIAASMLSREPHSIVPFQIGLMPSIFGPEVSSVGPNNFLVAISSRHART